MSMRMPGVASLSRSLKSPGVTTDPCHRTEQGLARLVRRSRMWWVPSEGIRVAHQHRRPAPTSPAIVS